MKYLIAFSLILAYAYAESNIIYSDVYKHKTIGEIRNPRIITGYFYTRVDHFTPRNNRTVQFTYYSNLEYYRDGGPLFFYINDATSSSTEWIERGLMYDLARELGAAMFTADHRYFGENIPTETASLDDLQYLTIQQSVADVAAFVQTAVQHVGGENSKVITFGSAYGGSLSAWARQKYPHLIDAAWSSSGLFFAQPVTIDFYTLLSLNILLNDIDCAVYTNSLFQVMEYLMENDNEEFLAESLNFCHPVDDSDVNDVARFFETILEFISDYIEQFHFRGKQNFCRDLRAIDADVLNSFARWLRFVYGDDECFDHTFSNIVELASEEEWNQPGTISGVRQWSYYQCTQIGLMKATSILGIFPNRIPASFRREFCEEALGGDYDFDVLQDAIDQLFIQFGGQFQEVEDCLFTNGMLDAWFAHGMTTMTPYVYNIPFHSRSADLESLQGWDPTDLAYVKSQIRYHITRWSYYETIPTNEQITLV